MNKQIPYTHQYLPTQSNTITISDTEYQVINIASEYAQQLAKKAGEHTRAMSLNLQQYPNTQALSDNLIMDTRHALTTQKTSTLQYLLDPRTKKAYILHANEILRAGHFLTQAVFPTSTHLQKQTDVWNALTQTTIAIAGLSVGSNVADACVRLGIGKLILADTKCINAHNLNRIAGATILNVAESTQEMYHDKLTHLARTIKLKAPFIQVTCISNGMTDNNIAKFVRPHADMVIDEMDSLQHKVQIRLAAAATNTPLIMGSDIDDHAILDVYRFDNMKQSDSTTIEKLTKMYTDANQLSFNEVLPLLTNEAEAFLDSTFYKQLQSYGVLKQLAITSQLVGALVGKAILQVLLQPKGQSYSRELN